MASDKDRNDRKMASGAIHGNGKKAAAPGWASGLRQLYDSVLDEPMPDGFKDLIAKLDKKG